MFARLGILAPSRSRAASKGLLLSLISTFIFILSTLILPLKALKDPSSTLTKFKHMPSKLIYFEDTPIILSHDSILREVWRSTDEGKSWNLISTVPTGDAWLVVEHTWDNRVAFILSRGSKHWRSINRGDSWQSFTTSDQPSISGSPLAFHSTNGIGSYLVFRNLEGKLCYDEVGHVVFFISLLRNVLFVNGGIPPITIDLDYFRCIRNSAKNDDPTFNQMRHLAIIKIHIGITTRSIESMAGQLLTIGNHVYIVARISLLKIASLGKNGRVSSEWALFKIYCVALKPGNIFSEAIDGQSSSDEMLLFVTSDGMNWARANFPHGHGLKENAYTIVESTPHSIMVDVLTHPTAGAGTLFTSDSNGTHFIKSLEILLVPHLVSSECGRSQRLKEDKKVQSKITFDDGGHWSLLKAPSWMRTGKFHVMSQIFNPVLYIFIQLLNPQFRASLFDTIPWNLDGIGNVGEHLLSYGEGGCRKYEIGDQGGLIVMLDDEETTTRSTYNFKQKLRVKLLTSVPDSTSQKFLLLGTIPKKNSPSSSKSDRQAVLQLDFSQMDRKKCQTSISKIGMLERYTSSYLYLFLRFLFEFVLLINFTFFMFHVRAISNISNGENLMPLASRRKFQEPRVMKRIVRVPTKI
ncbi:hypothetical protein PSTT_16517 [Puccinia striiformis]|uniref:VPS10 domain-containing protein n=1 Tax=Puccinia striiformis TaxID=27350 RepID=A0A2S4UCH5_9BASI|nr:hypothetical protein PSTT_16517 [Puccinia striiformis]